LVRAKRRSASDEPEALKLRQREHRLKIRVRPKLPVVSNCDPWLLADEGLDALDRIRLAWNRPLYQRGARPTEDFDFVAEMLRRLCWGPED
jgi:hypothetical protein